MKAEIIAIGDELLIGQVVDTNSVFITKQLNTIGISLNRKHAVADVENEIVSSISESLQRVDLVILTGGLGPTNDDVTREALARYFQSSLVLNKQVLDHISKFLLSRGVRISDVNKKQAMLPDNCDLLWNDSGTAPGMLFQENGKIVVSLPGVPHELKVIVTQKLIPVLKAKFHLPPVNTRTLCTCGLAESVLAEKLHRIESLYKDTCTLAYLPSPGIVRLRAGSMNESSLNACIQDIKEKLNDYIYADKDLTLQEVVGMILNEKKKRISIAESCTGGTISGMITSVPGSTQYFAGSVIAYSNQIKCNELSVKEDTINNYGAVSKETVVEMAIGIKRKFNTDISVATSGIAGPDGGTDEKPVGTVWIAVAFGDDISARKFRFGNERLINIEKASKMSLNMVRLMLLGKKKILEKMFD